MLLIALPYHLALLGGSEGRKILDVIVTKIDRHRLIIRIYLENLVLLHIANRYTGFQLLVPVIQPLKLLRLYVLQKLVKHHIILIVRPLLVSMHMFVVHYHEYLVRKVLLLLCRRIRSTVFRRISVLFILTYKL